MKFLLIFILNCVIFGSCEKARYDNYRVYRMLIETNTQLETLRLLADTSDSYNFIVYPSHINKEIEVVVPPHKFAEIIEISTDIDIQMEIISNNLQDAIDNEGNILDNAKANEKMDWTDYHSVDTIHKWLDSIKDEFPDIVSVTSIGTSFEGRSLKLLKISKKPGNRAIFVESHIHAREWITSATSTWLINELLRSSSADIKELVDNIDWYFLPIANPDGVEFTRNSNRLWRKTRSKQSILCWGVDPNRNFAHTWMIPDEFGITGSSISPCSDTYSGPYEFSEPECLSIDKFLDANKGIFDAYIALHSYGQYVLYPYGNSYAPVPNADELQQVGEAGAAKLKEIHGISYRVGNQAKMLYAASGNSQDHAYGKFEIPISYTIEMRGNDVGGFILPPEYIIPNAEEIMEFFIGFFEKAREFGRFKKA